MESSYKRHVFRCVLCTCFLATVFTVLILSYLCSDKTCGFKSWTAPSGYGSWDKFRLSHVMSDNMGKPVSFLSHPSLTNGRKKLSFEDVIGERNFEFDIKNSDVMVFLHIQKTGGTIFGRHLVRDLDLEEPCQCKEGKKKCKCFRPDSDKYWLFSRYSTGWKCGLHADWTELTNCVDSAMDKTERESAKRRYFYITLLRDPVSRFLSEFRHVQRGATWKTSRHLCNGRSPTKEELPPCFDGENWSEVTLEEFMGCPSNLAINRQTRMLADLTLIGCYNRSVLSRREREVIMLASAKQNLQKMAFYGLCEYQKMSQYLFENTFRLYFTQPFIQFNETYSSLTMNEISRDDVEHIRQLNSLDVELYSFAKALLFQRYKRFKKEESGTLRLSSETPTEYSYVDELFADDSS